ncbi:MULTISPECIES: VanW family protein [Clostridium]|uniref:VanW family protein n=1 Tax=Clostridium cibarium TaxID=2762247 RepID=A0ABR8PQ87_9CLOT|nr:MULTISPECIES: VanW family protein [Clostridium]MBD7910338.1 VanW family protein [Clostridium cibarium]
MGSQVKNISMSKSRNFQIIILGIIVIIFSGFLAYSMSNQGLIKDWENKVYPGVDVKDVELGGKSKEEASQILNDNFKTKLGEKKLNINVGKKTFSYTYKDLTANYNIDKAVEEALSYGKDKWFFQKGSIIRNNKNYEIDLDLTYDENKTQQIIEEVKKKVNVSPKNARISVNGDKIEVVPDSNGYELNTDGIEEKFKNAINNDIHGETNISLDMKEKKADITKEQLSKISGKMSTFSTNYAVGDRGSNLEIAASLVNGTILMPGQTFSYSDISQKGRGKYSFAGGYVNGKVEQVEAGGICQVCTTLYRAIMRSNIRSVERHNHMMLVGYSEPGLDATVSWGSLDYKFKNTYDFPIYIEGIGGGGTITFNIYGNPNALGGKTYELKSENLGTDAEGNIRAKSYQVTYQNGKEINRELISTDSYKQHS